MSNCSQNWRIIWNSASLCFVWLFLIGVWTFAWFVRPLLATIHCTWEIWSPHIQCITYFPPGKIKRWPKKNTRHCTDFEANRWPETFWGLRACLYMYMYVHHKNVPTANWIPTMLTIKSTHFTIVEIMQFTLLLQWSMNQPWVFRGKKVNWKLKTVMLYFQIYIHLDITLKHKGSRISKLFRLFCIAKCLTEFTMC